MSDFNVQKFKEAIFNQELFSVPLSSQKSVKETQNKSETDQPTTAKGRVWRNIKDSISSKFHRKSASKEIRETLVGSDHVKISNKNILKYLSKNINSISNRDDLLTLRATIIALKGFGADSAKCLEIEKTIEEKIESLKKMKRTSREFAEIGMKRNLVKAIENHRSGASKKTKQVLITNQELENLQSSNAGGMLKFNVVAEPRNSDEFDHKKFLTPIQRDGQILGCLTGVFEGHGKQGQAIANLANQTFFKLFSENLKKHNDNVLVAFEESFATLNQMIGPIKGGSTAIISYIDKETSKVYTATLGDCEAIAAREIDGKLKLIPLSPIRNLQTDAARVSRNGVESQLLYYSEGIFEPVNAEDIEKRKLNPQDLRIKGVDGELIDLSRSLGDAQYSYDGNGIISKSKVSVFELQAGDRLFLGGSEIFRNLPPEEIFELFQEHPDEKSFALAVYNKTKEKMHSDGFVGNASVIALNFK